MKKYKNILLILITNILIILISTKTSIFGSTMDFLNQHIIFPEYLRNTFYETGELIPKFAINIGAGQNIFNIAYYGLLNPIILLSYLFPFIKMIDYIILTNIILLISSNILFYKFIKPKFSENITLFLTLLFSLSSPLIFHFHRHFMFVNYIPFLLLALIHIDKNKKTNLILDIFLTITTSFYYSIPSILTILIYYVYINFDNFKIKDTLKLIISILTSILMSSVLLLPTLYTLIQTRTPKPINYLNLVIPNINMDNLLYGAYSPGLTSILVISLIYLLQTKKKKNTFLFTIISLLSFLPLSLYLLNGGLYTRSKALIPLLPLLILIIGYFIKDLLNNKIDTKKLFIMTLIINLLTLIHYHTLIYYVDLLLTLIIIIIHVKTKKQNILFLPLILISFIVCVGQNMSDTYINRSYYKEINKDKIQIDTTYRTVNLNNNNQTINKIYNKNYYTTSIYSSNINKYYKHLYKNTFKINNPNINDLMITSTDNILFNKYLGVKYIVSDHKLSYPYKQIDNNLYELDTQPILYHTSHTVNKDYYDKIQYPYNLDILLNYVIDENSTNKPTSKIEKIYLNHTYEIGSNISINKYNNKYIIDVKQDDKIIVNLKENLKNKILYINMYGLKENDKDIKMTINNQSNLLTNKNWLYPNNNNNFYFAINDVENKLEIKLTKGIYEIDNIETFVLDKNDININQINEFNIEIFNTKQIKGNITTNQNGYFIIKIPFDKGFNIKVNNQTIKYELINNTFMGFYLEKGDYEINITYSPILLNEGISLSILGFILFGIIIYKRHEF